MLAKSRILHNVAHIIADSEIPSDGKVRMSQPQKYLKYLGATPEFLRQPSTALDSQGMTVKQGWQQSISTLLTRALTTMVF